MNNKILNHGVVTQYMAMARYLPAAARGRHETKSVSHLAAIYGLRMPKIKGNRYDIWDRLEM